MVIFLISRYELDPTYYILKLLAAVGIVRDLRTPPLERLKTKLIDKEQNYNNTSKTTTERAAPLASDRGS